MSGKPLPAFGLVGAREVFELIKAANAQGGVVLGREENMFDLVREGTHLAVLSLRGDQVALYEAGLRQLVSRSGSAKEAA